MSSSIDTLIKAMSLEEADEPFILPDLPQFSSRDTNSMSLMGRLLNPDCQNVSDIVLDMPRKWLIYDHVRGVALSRDKFQFIFKYEQDLEKILNLGAHTYNQWSLLLQRWVEIPPPNYLQSTQIWVQIRNIPVNHHTKEVITVFTEFAGPVIQVEYDPSISQNKDFVRAEILFDVSKSLRRSKVINLPSGEAITIVYDYERIQKRCYFCQRLTHEREKCPLFLQKQKELKGKDKLNLVHDRSMVLSSFNFPDMIMQVESVTDPLLEKINTPTLPYLLA
ncbi:PREDICTED: uncharacterized protein LOC104788199 [Camelina sativa]|uniref:Uncharacterized protein LOC104788199 n=1 Tax=Camelina sativa TaxID=90675 RepID=A0ABM1RRR6_CAMSA|nr:PREDICTED: uncharacterized protein LOC104788199 [Camelina sativa]XP_019101705.1 PREDICTED: uncharacterized protein LOC104788199 [Camelina sativa]